MEVMEVTTTPKYNNVYIYNIYTYNVYKENRNYMKLHYNYTKTTLNRYSVYRKNKDDNKEKTIYLCSFV